MLSGQIERVGQEGSRLVATGAAGEKVEDRSIVAATHEQATEQLIEWLGTKVGLQNVIAVGHRVVHGGVQLIEHQLIDEKIVEKLRRTQPLDLAHLPRQIALIEVFRKRFAGVPQVACFDTAFHRNLPRVAKLLPIPRKYDAAGVRRFGFHGLSYTYLMEELAREAGGSAARGKIILAHLGSGASMAAVKEGKPVDTSMAFTPTAGLVMGTRPGDLDPGLLIYMMRMEKQTPEEMDGFISKHCGLIGISETSNDMRDLIAWRATDLRAEEAVELFCYQAKKFIGAYAAAMGGLDTLVFSAGIGEHSPEVRAGICAGLEFLGLKLNLERNARGESVISDEASGVTVRVMKTDEEIVIARSVMAIVRK